jgi:hypothetical protein
MKLLMSSIMLVPHHDFSSVILVATRDVKNFSSLMTLNMAITYEEEFLIWSIMLIIKNEFSTITLVSSLDIETSSTSRVSYVTISF